MSGITSTTLDLQQQLALLQQSLDSTKAEVDKTKAENPNIVNAYNSAKGKAQETVDWYNNQNFTDLNGNRLNFKTLKEWDDKCKAGGVIWDGKLVNEGKGFLFPVTQTVLQDLKTAETDYNRVMGPALERLNEAQKKLDIIGGGLKESMASLLALKKLLDSGDIEGAVMLLQTSRAKVLEQQLGARIEGMQARNAQIKNLNDQLKVKQGELAGVTGTAEQKQQARDTINAVITGLKGDMDKLNSDSQLDMIGIQGLVNKRNEAFDMLTNLLGKFQKTIDGIVSNLR